MPPSGRKQGWKLVLLGALVVATLVVIFFFRPIVFAIHDGLRDYAAYRYVHHLQEVDEIEICSLGLEASPSATDVFAYADNYGVVGRSTVRAADAAEIVALWCSLPTGEHRAMCLEPAYGLRFRHKGREVLKTSVCWDCEGLVAPTLIGGSIICGFDAHSEPAQKLLGVLEKHVPLPPSRIHGAPE